MVLEKTLESPLDSKEIWEIPWTEEPGRLESTGLQRTRHNFVTKQKQQRVKGRRQDAGVGSAWWAVRGLPEEVTS